MSEAQVKARSAGPEPKPRGTEPDRADELIAATRVPLWWLALLAGLLPLVATIVSFRLSLRLGLVPDCNPLIDGCVSISRAARHDLPNIVFRALMLPAAILQAACWLLGAAWLRTLGIGVDRLQRALPWVGTGAGLALAVYVAVLGIDGEGYRWMRRYGVACYFAFTCIAMLVVSDAMRRSMRDDALRRRIAIALVALCCAVPLIGLVYGLVPVVLPSDTARDAVQNVGEWWVGAVFTLFFFALAWAWRATRFAASLDSGAG